METITLSADEIKAIRQGNKTMLHQYVDTVNIGDIEVVKFSNGSVCRIVRAGVKEPLLNTGVYDIKPPYNKGEVITIQSKDDIQDTVQVCVKSVTINKLHDTSIEDVFLEGTVATVPAGLIDTEEKPTKWDDFTAEEKSRYCNQVARLKFLCAIEYTNRLFDAFIEKWNAALTDEEKAHYAWKEDPWTWVITFELV